MSTCSFRCLKHWDTPLFLANSWGVGRGKVCYSLLYGRRAQIQHRASALDANKKIFGVDTEWQGVTTHPKCWPQPRHICNSSIPLPAVHAGLKHSIMVCGTQSPLDAHRAPPWGMLICLEHLSQWSAVDAPNSEGAWMTDSAGTFPGLFGKRGGGYRKKTNFFSQINLTWVLLEGRLSPASASKVQWSKMQQWLKIRKGGEAFWHAEARARTNVCSRGTASDREPHWGW